MSDFGVTLQSTQELKPQCDALQADLLKNWNLIIASNRGPVSFHKNDSGEITISRGGGGLVTALSGLALHVEACWIASALTDADREWKVGKVKLEDGNSEIKIEFVDPPESAYDGYYNVISNPLLWFLQHSMWEYVRAPTINYLTWQAWDQGYVLVNRLFAEAIAKDILTSERPSLVMLQDYHLYLAPGFIRKMVPSGVPYTLLYFVHIPWPGPEAWGMLPPRMRRTILEGLCAVDLLGFQTKADGLNFIRTCESHLPGGHVNYRRGRIWFRNHATHVRDFPISINVQALKSLAASPDVKPYREFFQNRYQGMKLIVRIDRIEPSKNILRGFQAFDEMLELHPEHHGKVQFLAFMVPSRMEVAEYQNYLDELMAAAGRVNAHHGDSEWEPVRVIVGENYQRAVAALQIYDVLLVNSIADGMNLVAKEGPTINTCDGVVILSERTGARQQLEPGAIVISPLDVYATAEALHQALIMPEDERRTRAVKMQSIIEKEDINDWLCRQLTEIKRLKLI